MKKALLICFVCFTALYAADKVYGKVEVSKIMSIYDGDTFKVTIDSWPSIAGENIGIRVAGIDCPEMRDKRDRVKALAQQAKQHTVKRLREGKNIWLLNLQRDKYFRILADVEIDGKDLATELIKLGLAKPYDGGKKESW